MNRTWKALLNPENRSERRLLFSCELFFRSIYHVPVCLIVSLYINDTRNLTKQTFFKSNRKYERDIKKQFHGNWNNLNFTKSKQRIWTSNSNYLKGWNWVTSKYSCFPGRYLTNISKINVFLKLILIKLMALLTKCFGRRLFVISRFKSRFGI